MNEEDLKFPNVTTYVNVEKGGVNIQHVENFYHAKFLQDDEPSGLSYEEQPTRCADQPTRCADEPTRSADQPTRWAEEEEEDECSTSRRVAQPKVDECGGGDEEILARLIPIFMNDRGEAEKFLEKARCSKPKQITDMVKMLVKKHVISAYSCHYDLWYLLHENGLYPPTKSNWNQQV